MNSLSPLAVSTAIVRTPPDTVTQCLRRTTGEPIDPMRAAAQHAQYIEALRASAIAIRILAGDRAHPDSLFVEDTALALTARLAVIARPGASSRRGEVAPVAAALRLGLEPVAIQSPGTLDGGDVLRAGAHLFIGISSRTNSSGAEQLAAIARRAGLTPHTVEVDGALHLKSLCSLADHRTLVYDRSAGLELAPLRAIGLACLPVNETCGANVLALPGGRVLVPAEAPECAKMLQRRGLSVTTLELSEIHKADGGLTCLSIRIPAMTGWCA